MNRLWLAIRRIFAPTYAQYLKARLARIEQDAMEARLQEVELRFIATTLEGQILLLRAELAAIAADALIDGPGVDSDVSAGHNAPINPDRSGLVNQFSPTPIKAYGPPSPR